MIEPAGFKYAKRFGAILAGGVQFLSVASESKRAAAIKHGWPAIDPER
jgi:hypothetical protein